MLRWWAQKTKFLISSRLSVNSFIFDKPATAVLELPLLYFIFFLALSTLCLMVALRFSLRFSTASFSVIFSLLLAFLPLCYRIRQLLKEKSGERIDHILPIFVLIVSLAGGWLAASINRPDIDDSIYAPKAVYYTENIDSELSKSLTWIAGLPQTAFTGIFQYYETIQAALATRLHVPFLCIYHITFPAIVGFLTCISIFLVLSLFDQRRWPPLIALSFLLLIILSLGETHRAFGNLSFARAFHAKFMFIAVGVPAAIYFSLQFLTLGTLWSWIVLTCIGIGMAGATTTALIFLPFLFSLVVLSYLLNEGKDFVWKRTFLLLIKYISSLVPVAFIALDFLLYAQDNIATGSFINSAFPGNFEGHLRFILHPDYPLTPILFFASFITLLFFSRYRLFFLYWIALAILLFLNPFVSRFIIHHITTENIYWRLFYLLPFPIIVGIAYMSILRLNISFVITSIIITGVAFYFAFWGPTRVIRPENHAVFGFPAYKIHEPELSLAREIATTVPKGSMLAPLEISSNILLFSSKYPQFHMREDFLGFVLLKGGRLADFTDRLKLFRYLYQNESSQDGRNILEKLISSIEGPDIIVTYANSSNREEIRNTLFHHGYREASLSHKNYVLFQRI